MTTLNMTPTQPETSVKVPLFMSAAVTGFVVGLVAALIAMLALPSASLAVFLAVWMVAGGFVGHRMHVRHAATYWGEDFGGIRQVRSWD